MMSMMTTVQREQRLVGYNDRSSSSSNIGANKEQGPVELVAIRYPVIVTSTQQHRAMRLDGNNNYNNNNANNDNCIISIPPTQEGISGVEWSVDVSSRRTTTNNQICRNGKELWEIERDFYRWNRAEQNSEHSARQQELIAKLRLLFLLFQLPLL